jgi:hypothetical protein
MSDHRQVWPEGQVLINSVNSLCIANNLHKGDLRPYELKVRESDFADAGILVSRNGAEPVSPMSQARGNRENLVKCENRKIASGLTLSK